MSGAANGSRTEQPAPGGGWPTWACRLATLGILWHGAAILAGIWAAPPASELVGRVDAVFEPYDGFIRQGVSYRYYSGGVPPTPVVIATLAFRDGRPEQTVRLPDAATWPRLLYQRQLALANSLVDDSADARRNGVDPEQSRWARAYATHLGRTYPGCSQVTLRSQLHLVPAIERVQDELRHPRFDGKPVDLDADEFFTTPERIGVFPCDAS